jgi:hypothetical protein
VDHDHVTIQRCGQRRRGIPGRVQFPGGEGWHAVNCRSGIHGEPVRRSDLAAANLTTADNPAAAKSVASSAIAVTLTVTTGALTAGTSTTGTGTADVYLQRGLG